MQSHQHNDHNTESEIINAACSGRKSKLIFMLRSTTNISEETLYQVMKQMIAKKNKSSLDCEIMQIITNDQRFNPNYHNENLRSACYRDSNKNIFSFPTNSHLIKIAIMDECFASMILLLNHPKTDFENLKTNSFSKIALENGTIKTVNPLLRNPLFFALEKDWLAWADEKCPDLKIIFALNLCWHNWIQFTPDLMDKGLCKDIIHEVAKNLCQVSLFAKKEPAQTDTTECSPRGALR